MDKVLLSQLDGHFLLQHRIRRSDSYRERTRTYHHRTSLTASDSSASTSICSPFRRRFEAQAFRQRQGLQYPPVVGSIKSLVQRRESRAEEGGKRAAGGMQDRRNALVATAWRKVKVAYRKGRSETHIISVLSQVSYKRL